MRASVCLTRHSAPVICEADSAAPLCVRSSVRLDVFFSPSLKLSIRLSLKIKDRQNRFVCMYVCIFREKEIRLRTSVRPFVRSFVCPDVFFSPSLKWASTGGGGLARGGKLIIYNRGTGGVNGVKNRSGLWEGPGGGGSSTGALCTGYPLRPCVRLSV